MKTVFEESDIHSIPLIDLQREKFTLVVAAAGNGTRLNFDKPKILYPVCQRTILEWLIKNFESFVSHYVFVVSPTGKNLIEQKINEIGVSNFKLAIQHTPIGMGNAVKCSFPFISTPYTIIAWGDQVAIQPKSIHCLIRAFLHSDAKAAFISKKIDSPYIHFIRNSENIIIDVLQRREGDAMPDQGETDAGLFVFKTNVLIEELDQFLNDKKCLGKLTHEENFLPILPLIDRKLGDIVTSHVIESDEMMGINNETDAENVKRFFQKKGICQE